MTTCATCHRVYMETSSQLKETEKLIKLYLPRQLIKYGSLSVDAYSKQNYLGGIEKVSHYHYQDFLDEYNWAAASARPTIPQNFMVTGQRNVFSNKFDIGLA